MAGVTAWCRAVRQHTQSVGSPAYSPGPGSYSRTGQGLFYWAGDPALTAGLPHMCCRAGHRIRSAGASQLRPILRRPDSTARPRATRRGARPPSRLQSPSPSRAAAQASPLPVVTDRLPHAPVAGPSMAPTTGVRKPDRSRASKSGQLDFATDSPGNPALTALPTRPTVNARQHRRVPARQRPVTCPKSKPSPARE